MEAFLRRMPNPRPWGVEGARLIEVCVIVNSLLIHPCPSKSARRTPYERGCLAELTAGDASRLQVDPFRYSPLSSFHHCVNFPSTSNFPHKSFFTA